MKTIQLVDYIKENIENDYAMSVLYYSIRKVLIDNQFSFKNIPSIKIDKRFSPDGIAVSFNYPNKKEVMDSFILLLSIRALMLHKEWVDYCHNDILLFNPNLSKPCRWIAYASFITQCIYDDDFDNIFGILEHLYAYDKLPKDSLLEFENNTEVPEYKNLLGYYRDIAEAKDNSSDEVICNCAFVCDDSLIEYNVSESVKYIGNTAFSYCDNLITIRFHQSTMFFGKFPIVECNNLSQIIVPEGSETFYKEALPYYKNIIKTKENISGSFSNIKTSQFVSSDEKLEAEKTGHNVKQEELVNTKSIKKVFINRSTTYKFFWLMAIITLVKDRKSLTISFDDLATRMAAIAWPLIFDNKFDFGPRDKMATYLKNIKDKVPQCDKTHNNIEHWIKINYTEKALDKVLSPLLKNVPYRFLSPWIPYISDADVIAKSQQSDYLSPYAIYDRTIVLNDEWFDYFINNNEKIRNFIKEELTLYLKKYNTSLSLINFISNQIF